MFYKIVGVSDDAPDSPQTYRGEVSPLAGDLLFLAALAIEFGDGAGDDLAPRNAVEQLSDWSGGQSRQWADDLRNGVAEGGKDDTWACVNDGATFYVTLSYEPLG